jgi:hypothetical protein
MKYTKERSTLVSKGIFTGKMDTTEQMGRIGGHELREEVGTLLDQLDVEAPFRG